MASASKAASGPIRTETSQALDQLLGLGARLRRIAAGVGGVQLDRPAGERVVALLEEDREALLHLDAAGGERSGLDGQKTDADGRCLRRRGRYSQHLRRHAGGERSLDDGTAVDGHCAFSLWMASHLLSSSRERGEPVSIDACCAPPRRVLLSLHIRTDFVPRFASFDARAAYWRSRIAVGGGVGSGAGERSERPAPPLL